MNDSASPIVITGGAQRLGLATALALHSEHAPVVISYRKDRPLLKELRANGIETLQADFSEPEGALEFADELKSRYSSLRAIIHNASEWIPEQSGMTNVALMQRMMNVHCMAPYLINQECSDLLLRYADMHGSSDIIHLSDYVASIGSKKHTAYAAGKAALENLTLSFAAKLAPGVKVNSIAPALLMFNEADDESYRLEASRKALLGVAPGESEGVNAIRFILDSRYLTGKTIALDGGRHLVSTL
jgi:dihydromonapterin reductase/dihydrofolate reductase